ncbi:MAG: thioesterase [Clostridium sp.]|nr:thioesterase [Clostridium sp.]
MKEPFFESDYQVHHYEANRNGKVFVTSLMDYLEDNAVNHAEKLNIGIDYLLKNKIAWVIYKWDVKINKYPVVTEKLKVRTKPYSIKRFFAYRQYEILNSEDEVIASANSLWFLIDTERRRPTRVSKEMYTKFGLTIEDNDEIEFEKLKDPKDAKYVKEFEVRYSDIDTNNHVNNVKYITWALESVPKNILNNYKVKRLKVNYEKETAYGEIVKILSEIKESEGEYITISRILNSEGEKLTLIKMIWDKK